MKKRMNKSVVKASFDNLPIGICFFNSKGLPVLCNSCMHKLVFEMTGRDLQMRSDLDEALAAIANKEGFLKEEGAIVFPDNTVWRFTTSTVHSEGIYTQYVATNITEIYNRKKELELYTAHQKEMIDNFKSITNNVTAITREEEILSMKMHIHSEVGIFLQHLRSYKREQDHSVNKMKIVASLRNVTDILQGEIGHEDAVDSMEELCRVALSLGVTVHIIGDELKNDEKAVIGEAVRECVTNTLRHAQGNRVTVEISHRDNGLVVVITNNGKQPTTDITVGGGLSSLRRHIEKSGGTMQITSLPKFMLTITIPKKER